MANLDLIRYRIDHLRLTPLPVPQHDRDVIMQAVNHRLLAALLPASQFMTKAANKVPPQPDGAPRQFVSDHYPITERIVWPSTMAPLAVMQKATTDALRALGRGIAHFERDELASVRASSSSQERYEGFSIMAELLGEASLAHALRDRAEKAGRDFEENREGRQSAHRSASAVEQAIHLNRSSLEALINAQTKVVALFDAHVCRNHPEALRALVQLAIFHEHRGNYLQAANLFATRVQRGEQFDHKPFDLAEMLTHQARTTRLAGVHETDPVAGLLHTHAASDLSARAINTAERLREQYGRIHDHAGFGSVVARPLMEHARCLLAINEFDEAFAVAQLLYRDTAVLFALSGPNGFPVRDAVVADVASTIRPFAEQFYAANRPMQAELLVDSLLGLAEAERTSPQPERAGLSAIVRHEGYELVELLRVNGSLGAASRLVSEFEITGHHIDRLDVSIAISEGNTAHANTLLGTIEIRNQRIIDDLAARRYHSRTRGLLETRVASTMEFLANVRAQLGTSIGATNDSPRVALGGMGLV